MLRSGPGDSVRDGGEVGGWFRLGRFAILLAVLVAVAFPDVIFGGRTFFYRDFGTFGYPLAHYHRESFWRGEVPLWNPLNNCGLPFLAQWNTMVLYPPALFYLLFPLPWSLGVFCVLHLYLAGLGMRLLAYEWTGHRLAAAAAGIAFAFNGLTLSCLKWPNNIAALGWMPIVVLLAERAWRRGGRAVALAALAGAIQMLAGGPEIILLTWLIVVILWLAQLLSLHRLSRSAASEGSHRRMIRETAARFMALIGFVAGLAAAQLIPFFCLLLHSQRGPAFRDTSWAMPVWGWANYLVPLFRCFPSHQGVFAQPSQYWISSYYAGIGAVALAAAALWKNREPRVWLLAAAMILSLVLSLGPAGHLYEWLLHILPPLQIVRFPIKFVVVANFVLPLLAAWGIAALRSGTKANELQPSGGSDAELDPARETEIHSTRDATQIFRLILIPGVVGLAFIGAIVGFAHTHPLPTDVWPATWQSGVSRAVFLILTLVAAAAFGCVRRARSQAFWGLGLLLVLWLDVLTHAPRLSPTIERWVCEPDLAKNELKLAPEPRPGQSRAMLSPFAEFRLNHLALTNAVDDYLYSRLSLFGNVNLLDNLPKVDGFFSLGIREESQVHSLLYASTNTSRPGLERFLGVAQATAEDKVIHWNARSNYLAFATIGQAPVFADEPTTLRGLIDPNFDPARVVYLPANALLQTAATNGVAAKIRTTRFSAHHIEWEVEAAAPTWLVVAQSYYPPWTARIDGKTSRVWRANHAFQTVAVPAGPSRVRLSYEDGGFRIGAAVSILTLLLLLGLWRRRKVGPFFDPQPKWATGSPVEAEPQNPN